jgi:hypothetical protein
MIVESILAGSCCKIYDDLNDMNMFETLNNKWLKQNKIYINEFLKGIHFALFGLIVSKYSIFALGILVINLLPLITDSEAYYNDYGFSGYIVVLFIFCFLVVKKGISEIFSFSFIGLFMFFLFIVLTPICELQFKNVECGIYKFYQRLFYVGILGICLICNIIPNDSLPIVYYLIGYFGTSSMFQYYNLFCLQNNDIITPEILYNNTLNEIDEHFSDDSDENQIYTDKDINENTNDEKDKQT